MILYKVRLCLQEYLKSKIVKMKFTASILAVVFVFALCEAATKNVYGDVENFELIGKLRLFGFGEPNRQVQRSAIFPKKVIFIKNVFFNECMKSMTAPILSLFSV